MELLTLLLTILNTILIVSLGLKYFNDNYTIVESQTSFGISLYDHIALDGSAVKENQTIRN